MTLVRWAVSCDKNGVGDGLAAAEMDGLEGLREEIAFGNGGRVRLGEQTVRDLLEEGVALQQANLGLQVGVAFSGAAVAGGLRRPGC